jgi:tRNA(Ile)-lysidine synthase
MDGEAGTTRVAEATAGRSDALGGVEYAALFDRVFEGRSRILLAVSGGADSTALLALAAEWSQAKGTPGILAATVEHGLRPEAAAEADAVARLAERLGVPHARLDAPLRGRATRIEETARKLRYAALAVHARAVAADALATAHTLDDQAETVLLRLAAGSGPSGLAAIRTETARDRLVVLRPFLSVPKARLIETLTARGLGWAEDDMNSDVRFARARLRASRAVLAREGLTPERLAVLAFRMERVNVALDLATTQALAAHASRTDEGWRVSADAAGLADEIKLRLLGRLIETTGGSRVRLERLERLADRIVTKPAGVATLGGARVEWTESGAIGIRRQPPRRARADGRR